MTEITKEEIMKLNSFLERKDKAKISEKAKVSVSAVALFFNDQRDLITTEVQVKIVDATIELIDEKNKLVELAKEKIINL